MVELVTTYTEVGSAILHTGGVFRYGTVVDWLQSRLFIKSKGDFIKIFASGVTSLDGTVVVEMAIKDRSIYVTKDHCLTLNQRRGVKPFPIVPNNSVYLFKYPNPP